MAIRRGNEPSKQSFQLQSIQPLDSVKEIMPIKFEGQLNIQQQSKPQLQLAALGSE